MFTSLPSVTPVYRLSSGELFLLSVSLGRKDREPESMNGGKNREWKP